MKGNNEFILNQATMLNAVQLWLNDQFKIPPTATSVEQTGTGSYSREFTVKVASPEEEVKL